MNATDLSIQIERELLAVGFVKTGSDWTLDTTDMRWVVFFTSKRSDSTVMLSVAAYPRGYDEREGGFLINDPLDELVGGSSGLAKLKSSEEPHPLVRDTREVLIPLVVRLRTPDDVLLAWLHGELGDPEWPLGRRIAKGYFIARRLGFGRYENLAREIVRDGSWTNDDLGFFAQQGLSADGGVKAPVRPRLRRIPMALRRRTAADIPDADAGGSDDYSWDGNEWVPGPPRSTDWLTVNTYDGDIGYVRFRDIDSDRWRSAWVGTLPEIYFDDPDQAGDRDFSRTAAALAARASHDTKSPVDTSKVERLLRAAGSEEPLHTFVEETVDELVDALGLPPLPR